MQNVDEIDPRLSLSKSLSMYTKGSFLQYVTQIQTIFETPFTYTHRHKIIDPSFTTVTSHIQKQKFSVYCCTRIVYIGDDGGESLFTELAKALESFHTGERAFGLPRLEINAIAFFFFFFRHAFRFVFLPSPPPYLLLAQIRCLH